jgi:hypothetical protein
MVYLLVIPAEEKSRKVKLVFFITEGDMNEEDSDSALFCPYGYRAFCYLGMD